MALFHNICVNLRVCLCGVYSYASAQSLAFLDLAKNCSFLNWKLSSVYNLFLGDVIGTAIYRKIVLSPTPWRSLEAQPPAHRGLRPGGSAQRKKTKIPVFETNKNQFFYPFIFDKVSVLKTKEKLCGLCLPCEMRSLFHRGGSSRAPLSGISDMLQRVRDKCFVINKDPFRDLFQAPFPHAPLN
jgi:hypothetical protein